MEEDNAAPPHQPPSADPLVIRVTGHVLDYRDTAEIRRYLQVMYLMGLIPAAEYRARNYDQPGPPQRRNQ